MDLKISHHKKLRLRPRPFLLLLLMVFVLVFILFISSQRKPGWENKAEQPFQVQAEPLKIFKENIEKGFSLWDILPKYGFSSVEIYRLREQAKPVYDIQKIIAGHELRLFASPGGRVERIEYDVDSTNFLRIDRRGEDFRAEMKEFSFETRVEMVWGTVEDNPISAFLRKNEGAALALAFAELFAWDVDFYTDVRQDDRFCVIFEKKYLEGRFTGYGSMLAAEYVNQGRSFKAFRYTYPDTSKTDYFDLDGNSLRKEFLKSPIKYGRITSRFSSSRLHPIRKVYRPHYGVDYSAPVNTPIQATADGRVTFAGWNGASGRMIKIQHKNGYESMYLHLRRFGSGVRKGVEVSGGQVIGYVGSSGESTGPHLDYRIKYRGSYINPLGWRFKPAEPLRTEFLKDYKKTIERDSFALLAAQVFHNLYAFLKAGMASFFPAEWIQGFIIRTSAP